MAERFWFDPEIRCVYFSRTTFARFSPNNIGDTDIGNIRMLKKDPKSSAYAN
jgi:hypothetical protein